MKPFKRLFHFLGGLYVALFLIAITACWVIAGTFLESYFDSHLYASRWTYSHPGFGLLLSLLFINILFSALRRWPFKAKHIPFLITHLGLLMIIAGTLVKNGFGLQGNMILTEGSGSNIVILPHSYGLHIEKRDPSIHEDIAMATLDSRSYHPAHLPELSIRILGQTPHAAESFSTWIKGNHAFISGLPPLPVHPWKMEDPLPKPIQAPIEGQIWDFLALRTGDKDQAIQEAYLHQLKLNLAGESYPLKQCPYVAELSTKKGILKIDWKGKQYRIALQGNQALYPIAESSLQNGIRVREIDLSRQHPLLVFIEETNGDTTVVAFDTYGRIFQELFSSTKMEPLLAYDSGFAGYGVQTKIPFPKFPCGRRDKLMADERHLSLELKSAFESSPPLSPPLKLLSEACVKSKADLASQFLAFLALWEKSEETMIPFKANLSPEIAEVMKNIEWSPQQRRGCQWLSLLYERLHHAEDPIAFLEQNRWPFIEDLKKLDTQRDLLAVVGQQMLTLADQLPPPQENEATALADRNAHLLSAYFKAYEIDYQLLNPLPEEGEEDFKRLEALYETSFSPIMLETMLMPRAAAQTPEIKMENNRPAILTEFTQGEQKQRLTLTYQADGSRISWPVLGGEYKVQFQKQNHTIPHRVRLRQARQYHYANSNQPYSYECDVLIYENGQNPIETTLSMNQVHETSDGYRFYLAGMSSNESGLKNVHLVVNYDPVKYRLTYPGGFLVAAGIILLFWLRPYKK